MALPAKSKETTEGGVKFIETPLSAPGIVGQVFQPDQLVVKVNTQTGAADLYYRQLIGGVLSTSYELIASTDGGNNWNVKNPKTLETVLDGVPRNLVDTSQKRNDYFIKNYTYQLNNTRAQILNSTSPTGNNPAFANIPGYGNTPLSGASGSISQAPPTEVGGILGNIAALFAGGLPPVGEFDPADDNPAFKKVLKYPQDLEENQQDTLQIIQYEYRSPNENIFNQDISTILQQGILRNSAVKKQHLGKVILPIPNNPSDSNNVDWGTDDMNSLVTAATATAIKNTPPMLAGLAAGKGLGALSNFLPGISGAAAELAGQAPEALLKLGLLMQGNNQITKAAIYSFILNKYGFEVSPESILSRGLGVVPNSNLQLLFNNVKLRNFTFSYMMSPRSKSEAEDVNMILRFFKQGMAARKQGNNNLFLGTPNVFKLEYKSGNDDIAGMNKFKICALTGFGVNYAPSGQWMAYEKGQPASVVMTMAFNELEPIFETDYKSTSRLPLDSPPVKPNEIGF